MLQLSSGAARERKFVILNCCVLDPGRTLGGLWKGDMVWRWDGAENLGFEGQLKNNTEVFFLSTDGMGNCRVAPWATAPQTPGAYIFGFTAQNNSSPSPPHARFTSCLGFSLLLIAQKSLGSTLVLRNPDVAPGGQTGSLLAAIRIVSQTRMVDS